MKNLNHIIDENSNFRSGVFETNEDTRKLYRKAKIKYFKFKFKFNLYKAIMIFLGFIGILYIGLAVYYLDFWNTEQLEIQAPETHLATINGRETVIYTDQDGTRSASISYEYCEPLKFVDNCRWDRENFSIKF